MFLFLLQYILKFIDQLVGKGLGFVLIVELITLNLAWMLVLAVPIGMLFASLMAFGNLSASSETTIIKASGISTWRMMLPVLIVGIVLSYAMFVFYEKIVPDMNHRAAVLMSDIKRKKPTFAIDKGQFSLALEGVTILARDVDSTKSILRGVTMYDQRQSKGSHVINADSGRTEFTADYSSLVLTLLDGEIHSTKPRLPGDYRIVRFRVHRILIPTSGFNFEKSDAGSYSRGDREMRIADMRRIVDEAERLVDSSDSRIAKRERRKYQLLQVLTRVPADSTANLAEISVLKSELESEGFQREQNHKRAWQYEVEIQKKYAIPFACFVFILIGVPLGIRTKGGNFGISAAISLAVYIVYWVCLITGEKLSDRGVLNPYLSIWMGNIVIGSIGIVLFLNQDTRFFSGIVRLLQKK